jgi:hypothetical protein
MCNDATCWETFIKEDEIFNKSIIFLIYYSLQFFLWLKLAIQGTLGTKHVKYQGTLSNILPKRYP